MPGERVGPDILLPVERSPGWWVVELNGRRVRVGSALEVEHAGSWHSTRVRGATFGAGPHELCLLLTLPNGTVLVSDEVWPLRFRWPE